MWAASALITLVGCASIVSAVPQAAGLSAATTGTWSKVYNLPLSPLSAAASPTGEILLFSGNSPGGWLYTNDGGNRTYYTVITMAQLLNEQPITLQTAETTEMFCPGTTNLPDGSIMVNGGSGPISTVMYNPATKKFNAAGQMNVPRGYQANILTTSNKVFTIGGSFVRKYGKYGTGGRDGELFTPGVNGGLGSWAISNPKAGNIIGGVENGQPSPDPEGLYRSDNHAMLVAYQNSAGEAMVLHLGPVPTMHAINTVTGTITSLGARGTDVYSMNGNIVHWSPGRVYKTGGATAYGNSNSSVGLTAAKAAFTIKFADLPTGGAITVKRTTDMNYPRTFSHSIVLPGGKIFIVGGQTNIHIFEDTTGVLIPELYDPASGTYTLLPAMAKARNYHSFALLTKDGTVLVGGGGTRQNKCTTPGVSPCTKDVHFDVEVYTPPYISQGQTRPIITKVSTGTSAPYNSVLLKIGQPITVQATNCGSRCSYELLRLGSATHSVTNDQLRVPLTTSARNAAGDTAAMYTADLPFVTSGYYYLFAISSAGVPSVASIVQVAR
ncbi:uncharacterized protein EV422DRAFT_70220 [Fimicolochytrium jonesii]|uniref:uncharacterized protein n=1 Tax=Fimicolochytrium jonesii TaxID=1396493 RepID=UPI0022FF19B3|nr:uncharacterized protein EV422DRAFT_70220 [Fimicolochytrium jonesii]KAI8820438.1 hypothetical protein EV422DRAFT_70220 [Fimicolochytrium jonesii]